MVFREADVATIQIVSVKPEAKATGNSSSFVVSFSFLTTTLKVLFSFKLFLRQAKFEIQFASFSSL